MSLSLQAQLEDTRMAGIYQLPTNGRALVRQAAEAGGLVCFEVDLTGVDDLESALAALGWGLDLPEWYGQNLDALYDCLTDFSWCEAAGYVLLLLHVATLHAAEPEAFQALREVFAAASDDWRAQDCPFWVFLDSAPEGLPALPIPA